MLAKLGWLLFLMRGRISRFTYWSACIPAWLIFTVLFVFLESSFGRGSTLLLYPPFFWCLVALSVKRMHDRGRSPIWLIAVVVPLLGPLWLLVELGLRVGTPGENQYGADPLEGADYLVVE